MLNISYETSEGEIYSVTPMPSNNELFGNETVPNCSASDCCLIRAAQCLRSQGVSISIPALTQDEIDSAIEDQLADKDNWEEQISVSAEEVKTRKDEIRGYTDAELEQYIADNSVEVEDAVAALIKKVLDPITTRMVAVTVPSDEDISATILAEKELAIATSKVNALINSGHLVTDLSDPSFDAWKAQFTVTEVA